jgi:predicted metalloprotease
MLFRGRADSACGLASAATGPFYCPRDRDDYLDLAFFQELSSRFGAPGDFARAYVIAHEVGHHVQNQLGLMAQVQQKSAGASDIARNALSVRQELQADCFAGVWGHSAQQRGLIDAKDVESGIAAASAVGDDRLQQRSRGYVVPESFTHGTSAQRVRWFNPGLKRRPATLRYLGARDFEPIDPASGLIASAPDSALRRPRSRRRSLLGIL